MKPLDFPKTSLAAVVFSIVIAGCQADSPSSKTTSAEQPVEASLIVAEAGAESVTPATDELPPTELEDDPFPPNTAGVFDLLPEVPADMSPEVIEIIKLSHSGVSEEVQLAFVEASRSTNQPTADEIVYLQDVGVSAEVVSAMIRRTSGNADLAFEATGAVSQEPAPESLESYDIDAQADAAPESAVIAETQSAPSPVIVSAPERVTLFHDELTPYGRWIEVDGYGWCWKPSVAVVNVHWQPYRDRGRWLHSDLGWYWQSDYQWGWVAFHYGRWFSDPVYGWCWYPDSVWAPSWVTWRTHGSYAGWAPLPPYSWYRPGAGFIYRNRNVSFSFGFGLSYSSYSWCSYRNLCRPRVYRYCEPRGRYHDYHRRSTVVNNYVVGDNNVIINNGVHIDRVNTALGEQVKRVSVRQISGARAPGIGPDSLITRGGDSVVVAQRIENRPSTRNSAAKVTTAGGRDRAGVTSATTAAVVPSGSRSGSSYNKVSAQRSGRPGVSEAAVVDTPSSSRAAGTVSRNASAAAYPAPSSREKSGVQSRSTAPAVAGRTGSTPSRQVSQPRAAATDSQLWRNQYEPVTKTTQTRTQSRTATTRSSAITPSTAERTTRVAPTTIRQPRPVIISPSGTSPNSRYAKPTIIGPSGRNDRSGVSSPSVIRSAPSSSRTSPSISPNFRSPGSSTQPRLSTEPSSRSGTSVRSTPSSSRAAPVQTRMRTEPSSRSSSSGTSQRKEVQSRSR